MFRGKSKLVRLGIVPGVLVLSALRALFVEYTAPDFMSQAIPRQTIEIPNHVQRLSSNAIRSAALSLPI